MAKILVVEDNEINQDLLCRRLKRTGFEVLLAANGQEGIDLARAHHPDLILMDMSLPQMDGWTATRILKSESQTASIPIIALTAHAMAGDQDKALQAGCDDYDTKPMEFNRLLTKINHRLKHEPNMP